MFYKDKKYIRKAKLFSRFLKIFQFLEYHSMKDRKLKSRQDGQPNAKALSNCLFAATKALLQ